MRGLEKSRWPSRRSAMCSIIFIALTFLLCVVMKEKIIYAASLFWSAARSWPFTPAAKLDIKTYDGMPKLKFRPDGTFKITILEDLHFGEGENNPPEWGWGPISDQKSLGVVNTILDMEVPDLVVLNGDLITGENTYLHNSTLYLDMIVEPIAKRNIPFCATFGNHDNQFNLSTQRLLEHEISSYPKMSYTRSMISSPEAGVSNYVLPIYSSGPSSDSAIPALLLWFFDSKGGSRYQEQKPDGYTPDDRRVPIADFVDPTVADWLVRTDAKLVQQYGHKIPSLAFVHIPVYAMRAFQKQGVDAGRQPGINDDNPLSSQSMREDGYGGQDVPFMKALVDVGVKAVFSGHDHGRSCSDFMIGMLTSLGDDWCFRWNSKLGDLTIAANGMFACFGRHTGYGGYGTWDRGSRQILLHERTLQDEIATWIRLEDSMITGSVTLNDTYGTDVYPIAPPSR